jgi:hypothetical protein
MAKFLILQADFPGGRGVRGKTLSRFLRIFHGWRSVESISTAALQQAGQKVCDTLFIGMPSAVRPADLARVRFRTAVLFDYLDSPGASWGNADRDFLRSLTNRYLKAWTQPGWDPGLQFGVLPIRRYPGLVAYVRARRATAWLRSDEERRRIYDVAFAGYPTGRPERNQRIAWVREVRAAPDRYRFWGGLIDSPLTRNCLQQSPDADEGLLLARRRLGFFTYFHRLLQSRVALTPTGNAPWSYRHYEAIYAGAIVVTCDFRQIRTLIPLPLDGMIHVPEGASVLAPIDRALALRRQCPELAQANIRFLEQYLHDSDYTRRKPELMDRFLAQLESP